jgi:hypothetical protein
MKEVLGKIYNESIFIVEEAKKVPQQGCFDVGLHTFMKRILVFDLVYLKELKQDTFRSDFDELSFALNLLFDITRIIVDKDPALSSLNSDSMKMTRAFSSLKNRVGIMVPFERCIEAFRELCEEPLKRKMGIECEDDIFIGTPDMFRGVEKDIVILSSLRNSAVDGLAQLDDPGFVKLAFSRCKHFLWLIGSSVTFRTSETAGASLINNFIKTSQLISIGANTNYYEFVDFKQWRRGGLSKLIQKLGHKNPHSSPKKEKEEEKTSKP